MGSRSSYEYSSYIQRIVYYDNPHNPTINPPLKTPETHRHRAVAGAAGRIANVDVSSA